MRNAIGGSGFGMAFAAGLGLLGAGCGDPCVDDGFGDRSNCASASGTSGDTDADGGPADASFDDDGGPTSADTDVATGGADSGTAGDTTSGVVTDTDSGPTSGPTSADTGDTSDTGDTGDTGDSGDTGGTGDTGDTGTTAVFCTDADMDGFGDAADCFDVDPDNPPPGTVPQAMATDCDDDSGTTFPGAAPNDDPLACMNDDDGDDWGDDAPPAGVAAGTDCDDAGAQTFPGAARSDVPPGACMTDADMDGFGDDTPGPGVTAGNDCDDGNAAVTMCGTWCLDGDGDGFGDPAQCVVAGAPPTPDHVANAGDCDDNDGFTFPGASPNEAGALAMACTTDVDGDDFGETNPLPGVDAGTDCDDTDPLIFPGVAFNEPLLCGFDGDGDGWGDWDPPGGADPGMDCDDADASIERCGLLVTQDGTANHVLDQGIVTSMQNVGLTVILGEDVVATPADADPASVVVISETALSTQVNATWRDIAKPVIVMEGVVWDDMEMAPSATVASEPVLQIVDAAHPIAAGLVGVVQFMLANPGSTVLHTTPPAGANNVAARVGNPAQVVVFAFDAGDPMLGGFVAPAARVGFGADVDGGTGNNGQLGADGLTMLEAALNWCLP